MNLTEKFYSSIVENILNVIKTLNFQLLLYILLLFSLILYIIIIIIILIDSTSKLKYIFAFLQYITSNPRTNKN